MITLTFPTRVFEPSGANTPLQVPTTLSSETDPTVVVTISDDSEGKIQMLIATAIANAATATSLANATDDQLAATVPIKTLSSALNKRIAAGGN